MFTQKPPSGANLNRTTSGVAMLAQPRRQRNSETVPPMPISSKLLGLSEANYHKKDHSVDESDSEVGIQTL